MPDTDTCRRAALLITYFEYQARACVLGVGTLQQGQPLAQPPRWASLGRIDTTAWGACAGSGAKPYLRPPHRHLAR